MGHVENLLPGNRVKEVIGLETNICSEACSRDLKYVSHEIICHIIFKLNFLTPS